MSLRTTMMAAAGGILALLLILLQVAGAQRDQARSAAREAGARAISIAQDAAAAGNAARVVEAAQAVELSTTLKAQEASDEIARAAGADAPVPPDVLRLWGAAVDGLRLDAARAATGADTGGADPAGAVPPAAAADPPERG